MVVWALSNGLKVKSSRHTALPPERAEAETERSVYLQAEQVSAHGASECFDFKLKPRSIIESEG